jgi:hypothetical protein
MRWLLVTNYGNPGDEFARMGVERIIETVDPDPVFSSVRRDPPPDCGETPISVARPFDIAVVCSMPGFWSHPSKENPAQNNSPTAHHSWSYYNGWLASKGTLLVAGFGTYLTYKRFPLEYNVDNRAYLCHTFGHWLRKKCAAHYCRSTLGRALFGQNTPCHPCPSIFAGMDKPRARDLKLCNFMSRGAHYPWMDLKEANKMEKMLPRLAEYLLDRGFTFMAHRQIEHELAIKLGWAEDEIVNWKDVGTEPFLDTYSRAQCYIGNRIHGAIVSRSFGANTLCIGYDSRLRAVEDVGGTITTPRRFKANLLQNWLDDTALDMPLDRLLAEQRKHFKKVYNKAKRNK